MTFQREKGILLADNDAAFVIDESIENMTSL